MLKRLKVKGFKTLQDFTIDLAPVTVLVGANNVGKTNVVRAIEFLSDAIRFRDVKTAINKAGGPTSVFTSGGNSTLSIHAEGELSDHRFTFVLASNSQTSTNQFHLSIDGRSVVSQLSFRDGLQQAELKGGDVQGVLQFLANMRCVDFSPERLREQSQPSSAVELGREGQNLAAVLDRLAGERPQQRRRIDEEVSRAISNIDGVITIPRDNGYKIVGIAEGNTAFSADAVSDGILLFVALSTVAQMSGGSALVAIEEIERGIHPRRIRETLDQILRVSQTGTQFLLTTHSPILLSEFRDNPEAVVILERDAERGTTARKLSDLELAKQATDVSLGDLWFSGVLGGVPASQ